MNLIAKAAEHSDWEKLNVFYKEIYKPGHPLQNFDFWKWQYGDADHGRSFIVCNEQKVYGHVGAYFVDGYAWMINVYMDTVLRGQGWVGTLYKMAREAGYPLAATSANTAGLGLYRKMNWIRYSNLERRIIVHPDYASKPLNEILSETSIDKNYTKACNNYYWQQPGVNGIQLNDGSTAVAQTRVGGLRFVDMVNDEKAIEEAWDKGFKWCDYVSSWNDPLHDVLGKKGWINNENTTFPWYLSPVDENKKFVVSYLSEDAMEKKFIVKRYHSDHGRVGSLTPDR